MYLCTYVPWRTPRHTHRSPPSPTVPLCLSVLTFLGVPLSTPTGLHPHPLYLYVYLYSRSLAYPLAHPQVCTLTHSTSMYVSTYVPWHTPRHTHRFPPSPTVPRSMSVLTFLGIPLSTPTGFHLHPLYLYVYLYSRSLVYPSAHPHVSTLTHCTSMYICTYVPWHTPQHTHTSPPSPTVPLCISVLTFLGIPLSTPTRFHPHPLYLYVCVSLQLRMQNQRRKLNFPLNFRNDIIWTSPFPLNIRNSIIWGGAFSKAFRSSEGLFSVLSKNARLYDNI